MANSLKRIYWDSCAWIGYLNKETDKDAALREIWLQRQDGLIEIWTSTYSYIEVIYGLNDLGEPYPPDCNDQAVFALLESANVERVQVDVEVAKLARQLRRAHNPVLRKRPDAIHLATAAYWNCDEMHTWDGSDLLPLDGKVLRRDGVPLTIIAPAPSIQNKGELPLFAAAKTTAWQEEAVLPSANTAGLQKAIEEMVLRLSDDNAKDDEI